MKKQIKKVNRLIVLGCFAGATLMGCGDDSDEIFDNVDPQEENATDENNERTSSPGAKIK